MVEKTRRSNMFYTFFFWYITIHIVGNTTCVYARDSYTTSQIELCNKKNWSSTADVCLHEGHEAQFSLRLRPYAGSGRRNLSVIQLAKENHELFKDGKISFGLRKGGLFGGIGYGHDSHRPNVLRRHAYKFLQLRHDNSLDPHLDTHYVPIRQMKDSLYIGTIFVGSPPQEIHPIFDTGSTNLWVVGTKCQSPSCRKVVRFNPTLSKTFKALSRPRRIHIKFGTGEIEGTPALDYVSIGGMNIRQPFAIVEDESGGYNESNVFDKIKFEGIVGLAFPEMSSIPGPSVFDNLSRLKHLKNKEFAFYIDDENSLLMFGGVDKDFYEGSLKMFPVVREHYWEVKLDAIYIGKKKVCCDEPSYVIFDSGTSLNSVPSKDFRTFVNMLPYGKCPNGVSDDSAITYVLGGQEIKLTSDQYMLMNQGECIPAYMQLDVPSEFGHAYILGSNAFMRHYFTVFRRGDGKGIPSMVSVYDLDYKLQVGIAPSKHGEAASNKVKVLSRR